MAFHGSRGSSRGRAQASSLSRGRGGRRRGYSSGRGRGKPVFDSARLAQKEIESDLDTESNNEGEVEESGNEANSSDSDNEDPPPMRSYAALMQSISTESVPRSKRRKVHHDYTSSSISTPEDIEPQSDIDIEDEAEDPETAIEEADGEEDLSEDKTDPFRTHFAEPEEDLLKRRLKCLQAHQWTVEKSVLPEPNKAIVGIPEETTIKQPIPNQILSFNELKLKQKLAVAAVKQRPSLTSLEQTIAPIIFNYQDILYCERNVKNAGILRRLACLHVINHIFKTRDQVIKNNSRLAREETDDTLELRDQGYTRPKVLIILPTRESCVRMVNMITSLCEPEQQENRKRFDESYVEREEKFSSDKPDDFRDIFGGNDDDMFRLGMKFTRKTVKYFSQFYNSDIIFGSPLGLRMAIGSEEDKKLDYDFLSSIEIVVVDQIEGLLMQNWDHMEFIFDHLNLQPKEAHGCDFSRVRSWCLDDNSKYFRQTIAFSAFNTPEINTLFYNQSKNWAGKIKINRNYGGAIQEIGMKVKQTFSRLESPSFATDPEARFNYFTTAIVTSLVRHKKDTAGTLIFIPSYVDFVRVRNYFATSSTASSLSFGSISEYTSVKDVSRARSHFLTGRHNVLLYTERAHHFRRYHLRGVKKVIMYGLPDNPIFYKELVGGYLGKSIQEGIIEPGEGSVRAIFSKWDMLKLERIVGSERVGRMIKEKGDTFDFI
ncbi:U3 small nucleolar RNA-associated protein 25 [Xylogone sp. PMI_703]|nr:U3 small nucleolar RNA-associated protein 25 [Xylogone sp. PMI_703]